MPTQPERINHHGHQYHIRLHDREEMSRVRINLKLTRGKPGDHVSVQHFDELGAVWKRHYHAE